MNRRDANQGKNRKTGGDSGIVYKTGTSGRDSPTASGRVTLRASDRTSLSVEAGGEFFRNGFNSAWGCLSVTLAF